MTTHGRLVVWCLASLGWNSAPWAAAQTLENHPYHVGAVAASVDGKWLATGTHDGGTKGPPIVFVWNTSDGSLVASVTAHKGSLQALAFSPDGKWLASGAKRYSSDPVSARIWSTADWKSESVAVGTAWDVHAIAWSSDSRLCAFATKTNVVVFDVTTRAIAHSIDTGPAYAVAFSPGNKELAMGAGQRLQIHPLGAQEPRVATDLGSAITGVAYDKGGKLIVAGTQFKVHSVEAAAGKPDDKATIKLGEAAKGLIVSPDGKRALSCASGVGVLVVDFAAKSLTRAGDKHVWSAAWIPGGKRAALAVGASVQLIEL